MHLWVGDVSKGTGDPLDGCYLGSRGPGSRVRGSSLSSKPFHIGFTFGHLKELLLLLYFYVINQRTGLGVKMLKKILLPMPCWFHSCSRLLVR